MSAGIRQSIRRGSSVASSQTRRNINDEIATPEEEKLADNIRKLAFRIVAEHHVAATFLTIAAAAIAPESDIDIEIADYFFQITGMLENELTSVHHEKLVREDPEGRLTTDGIRVKNIEGDLGERLKAFVNRSPR